MNTKEFNNNNSILRKEVLKVTLDDNNAISKIEYYTPGGNILKKYQYFNSTIFEKLNEVKIINMAYILCLFDTQKFYELYKSLNSDSDKKTMISGLKSVLTTYQKFLTSDVINNELQEPFPNNKKEFSTLGSSLSDYSNQIILDSNNYLDTCKMTLLTNEESLLYKRDIRMPYTEKNISYKSLNKNVCREFSKQLCRSDIKEYQRLIDNLSYRDPYYHSVLEGGNSFANEVKKLVKKCN